MIPPALEYRIGEINSFSRERISIQPNGNTTVHAGQKLIIDLPYSTLIDLESLALSFTGVTTAHSDDAVVNKRYFFPRNIASIIETLEVKFNNVSVQTINNYGLLYNKLIDLTMTQDACYKKNCMGENSDPSYRVLTDPTNNAITVERGYANKPATTVYAERIEDRDFVIKSFLGILGSGSTTAIDTGLVGNISIHITLNNGSCLMSSAALVDGTVGGTDVIPTFSLENILCKMTRYQMSNKYYNALQSHLASKMPYEIAFENYEFFSGPPSSSFNNNVRFTTASKSLRWIAGTYMFADRDSVGPVLLTDSYANDCLTERVNIVDKDLYNNSRYFYTFGGGIDKSLWKIGSTQIPSTPATKQDRFITAMELFNQDNDTITGVNKGICSLPHFENGFFLDVLPLSYTRECPMYTMSGLDTLNLPLSIVWSTSQSSTYTDTTLMTPLVVACSDKIVQIYEGQQVKVV